jgi:hypothetical protein
MNHYKRCRPTLSVRTDGKCYPPIDRQPKCVHVLHHDKGVLDMPNTIAITDAANLPLAPKNPLPYWQRLTAARSFDTGFEKLRDAGPTVEEGPDRSAG